MLTYSLGLAVPFMAAALALSRAMPTIDRLPRFQRRAGLITSVLMVVFGVVLIADNFHVFSDAIYPYLPLPAKR